MRKEPLDGDWVFVIHDFLSPSECLALIDKAEGLGFAEAPVGGMAVLKEYRDSDRVMFDDPASALQMFERCRAYLPQQIDDHLLTGLNERFRMYRYDPGQRFKPHWDGSYIDVNRLQESLLTFMVYLNEGFEGGATNFYWDLRTGGKPRLAVQPRRGMALVFFHRQVHEGEAVVVGRKYVLRTDVMYHEAPPRSSLMAVRKGAETTGGLQ